MNYPGSQVRRRGGIVGVGADAGRLRRRRRTSPDLLVEALEDRSLLATLDITGGVLTYSADALSASELTISIDSSNTANVIFADADQTISLTGGAGTWAGGGTNTVTGPLSSFTSLAVNGLTTAGQSLTLDYSNGDPLPASGLTFDPTAAVAASNALTLQSGTGGTTFTSETYTPSGAGAGTITYSDATSSNVPITFSNLSPVIDNVPSPTFIFAAPAAASTVDVVDGGGGATLINDGGTSQFESINFANKAAATVNANNAGATISINNPNPSAALTSLNVFAGAGGENVYLQAVAAAVTTTVDMGSVAGSTTTVGLTGSLAGILGPVYVQSTGGNNALAVDDSSEVAAQSYTIASDRVTASSFPSFIDFGAGGIRTLNLTSAGVADTFNFTGPVNAGIGTYNFSADGGGGPNVLDVTSNVAVLDFATAGVLGFGAGNPVVNYTNFQTINVTKPASPPAGTNATINGTEGVPLNNVVVATFTQDDLGNAPGDFSATIDWGDSTTSPGTIVPTGPNGYDIQGSHTYTSGGNYPVNVTLTDNGNTGSTTVGGTTINVTSTGPVDSTPSPIPSTASITGSSLTAQGTTVTGQEGTMLSAGTGVLVATFMDSGTAGAPTDYAASIDWGDGSTSPATQITSQGTPNGIVFSVYGNHQYGEEGTYAVNVTITRTGPTAIASGQAVIGDAAITGIPPTPTTLTANTGTPLPAGSVIGSFMDANTTAPTTDFTATIEWGDGSAKTIGTVVAAATLGNFDVQATHTYARPGTYTPTIIVHDVGGSVVTLVSPNTAAITVSDAAVVGATRNFTAVEGINTGLFVLATYTDPNTLATVANESASLAANGWGDGTPASATPPGSLVVQQIGVTPLTAATNPGAPIFQVLGSHTYTLEFPATAPAPLSIVITTLGGTTTTLTSAAGGGVTVLDAPLTSSNGTSIAGIEGSATTSPSGQTGSLLGTFTDANPAATTLDFTTAPGSVVVDWGDGHTSTPTITQLTTTGTTSGAVFRINASHTYAEAGTYTYTVIVTDMGGSMTTFSGPSVIADAPLAPAATQPVVSTTEDVSFSGAVGSFTDGNTMATVSDYTYVMIDWGDGSPQTSGTVAAGSPAGTFIVSGTHTYGDAGVNGGTGHYPIAINVHDVDGATVTIANTANVADVPLSVTGSLNPASDSGSSNTDDITNVVQPNFHGTTSEPNATIALYATAAGSSTPVPIGTGVSDASGAWSITATWALADGAYTITAIATDASGHTTSPTTTIVPNLVIDTVGPKVTSIAFTRSPSQVVVTFQDLGGASNAGSGVNLSSIVDASNYRFVAVYHVRTGEFRFNFATVSPGTNVGTQSVTLSINKGHYIKGGWFFFTVYSASPTRVSGARDIAGNALDGEFFGYFPSGNNVPGGNFVAQLTAFHNTIYPPSTVVGRGSPVSPPGTRQHSVQTGGSLDPRPQHHVAASARGRSAVRHRHGHGPALRVRTPAALVRHTGPGISHRSPRVGGPMVATPATAAAPNQATAIGALSVLDQALDQVGTSRHRKRGS